MRLHHIPGSRSARVRWLLEELGESYELVSYTIGDPRLKSAEYRALNPLGLVPTLEDKNDTLFESGAIVQFLLERYGAGRLEPSVESPERAAYLQWFHWGEATAMAPLFDVMRHRFVLPESERSDATLNVARDRFRRFLEVLDEGLGSATYLVGDRFSAADIMNGYALCLAQSVGELPAEPGRAVRYLEALAERTAFQVACGGGFEVE